MEDNRTSDKDLVVARSYKESGKIYRWIQSLSMLQE